MQDADPAMQDPNGVKYDNLYVDMNAIIHPCFHPDDDHGNVRYSLLFIYFSCFLFFILVLFIFHLMCFWWSLCCHLDSISNYLRRCVQKCVWLHWSPCWHC